MNVEPLGQLARTHTCGQLRKSDVGSTVRPRPVLGGKTEGFLEQGIQGYREREEQAF